VDTKELDTLNLLHYSSIDMNWGLRDPPLPIVHNHLLCLDHVEGEVVILAPHCQVSDLLPTGCLIFVSETAYNCVSYANLMMVLESCLAMESWVKREYRRGMSMHASVED
jgi:hypothetical protein